MARLAGKVAFVTGAGTGIGRACAELFAREGARVTLAGRRREPLESAVRAIREAGGEALAVPCDVTQAMHVEQAIAATVSRFGRLDVLVNNAGALLVASAAETSEEEWDRLMDVNLKGAFLVSREAVKQMRGDGGGAIVNIGSVLGLVAMPKRAAYAASKGGLVLLTKAMAIDHAAEGIRVNCICPSIVDTELVQGLFATQPDPEAARRARAQAIPLGRFGQPVDVAQLAVFLASDESSWITGAAIPVDGGLTAY
ncbi:MAG: SDR family NAD(P)-dependent oxidoreductase [Candidatus Acidiferrales bacterium]